MNFGNILSNYLPYKSILSKPITTPVSVSGISDTAQPHLISSLAGDCGGSALVITYTDMEARELYNDLKLYCDNAALFPSKDYIYYNIETAGHQNENSRLEAISKLINGKAIIVASLDAVMCYTLPKVLFEKYRINFELGDEFDLDELAQQLIDMGYTREDMIEGEGQFAIRGGILDIFSPNYSNPLRIEFFDNETDSIREFDVYTQRSLDKIDSAQIVPVSEMLCTNERRESIIRELKSRLKAEKEKAAPNEAYIETLSADIESFEEGRRFPSMDKYVSLVYGDVPSILDYFTKNDIVVVSDPKRICERGQNFEWEKGNIISELKQKGVISPHERRFYYGYNEMLAELENRANKTTILIEPLGHTNNDFSPNKRVTLKTKTTISFHGKMEYLYDSVKTWKKNKYTVVIFVSARSRAENIAGVLNERGISARLMYDGGEFESGETVIIKGNISKGFEYPELHFAAISDREIFEAKKNKNRRDRENANRIKSYNDINPGDYVIHASHGVGQYVGTEKIVTDGMVRDYLKILYYGTDVLYVPIEQLDMLFKYNGNPDKPVKLNKLGTQEWNKAKARAKKATEELAQNLIKLYAERSKTKGFAFSSDSVWQREFEDTFPYQETADQLRSIEEVKEDMESSKPMDRLLCGDVGFGKTEVALRAAFKAVMDSKQVAYLCPTTVLAMQHYETFLSRMKEFPIKIEMLSRFRTAKQQKNIIKKLKTGEIDIIVGTHRILSKDIQFKDLGLLIVDEEQRFGVAHKEKIKELKTNIDVLTMTATPIPRTLHMAMTSIRDMSVLSEAPQNRYPVQTYVLEFNPSIILDGIRNELARNGQVFYLYNRVKDIYAKAEWLKQCFPDKNIMVGHGKMDREELEEIMLGMINGEIDILVCTTIIETGLDISNANTMIIEDADHMGLAQLYQLRGRVGRSNKAAYAYLTYNPGKMLTDVASKRLQAIREFTEFGSGFKIAMRDLEIRGAGNVLGDQQSGHMEAVGYDIYCKLLQESINEAMGIEDNSTMDVTIDININAYIPDRYISNHNQRIDMYKKIAAIASDDDKFEIEDELIDRYGDYPNVVQNIIDVAALKIKAREAGIYEIKQLGKKLQLKFSADKFNVNSVMQLDKVYPKRVKLLSGEEPVINIILKDEDKNMLKFAENVMQYVNKI